MQKKLLVRILACALLWVSVGYAHRPLHQVLNEGTIEQQIDQARENFEGVYYQLVEKGHFPLDYNNNLIIHADLEDDTTHNGMILLGLIEWLEKQEDRDSAFLLRKFNKLFFLEFHRTLARMNLRNTSVADLVRQLHDLYQSKVTVNGYLITPFRSMVSKCFLMISIVNESDQRYEARKEMLLYTLDKVKRELLLINRRLDEKRLEESLIESFIMNLGVYAAKEPLVKSGIVKKVAIGIAVVAVVGFLVHKIFLNKKEIKAWMKQTGKDIREFFIEPIGEGLVKSMLKEAEKPEHKEHINQILEEATRSAVRGAAYAQRDGDGPQQPNPDLPVLTNQLVHGILTQQPYQAAAQPPAERHPANPDIAPAVQEAVRGARQGAVGGNRIFGWMFRD